MGADAARLLLADVYHLTGDPESARKIATEVLPIAEAYHFDGFAAGARAHIDGDPIYEQLRRKFLVRRPKDPDLQDANMTDEMVKFGAEMYAKSTRLDSGELVVFTRLVTSWRQIARERLSWCRHMDLVEVSPALNAAGRMIDPLRQCYCDKLKVESSIALTDWETVINSFKQTRMPELLASQSQNGP